MSEPTAAPPYEPGSQAAVPDEPEPELQADRILAGGDRRDDELRRREAKLEAAFGVREDRIEQREGDLADAQAKLERREQELNTYVTRLQAEFSRRA